MSHIECIKNICIKYLFKTLELYDSRRFYLGTIRQPYISIIVRAYHDTHSGIVDFFNEFLRICSYFRTWKYIPQQTIILSTTITYLKKLLLKFRFVSCSPLFITTQNSCQFVITKPNYCLYQWLKRLKNNKI